MTKLFKFFIPFLITTVLAVSVSSSWAQSFQGPRPGGATGPAGPAGGGIISLLMDAEKTRYVTKNGNDANDGKSWDKAKLTIRNAVESLPEEGSGIAARKGGDIHIGQGLFVENGIGLAAGEPIIETSSNIRFWGAGVPVNTNGAEGGTVVSPADGSNRHLFGPRSTFAEWGHNIIFSNMGIDGNKANNVGAFDLVRINSPGFNAAMYNVSLKNASRYCIKLIDNAVNFYGFNLTGAGCNDAFFHMNLVSSANTTNAGFYGLQVDNSGDYPFQIDSSADGEGVFFINGLETEALFNLNQHKAVIQYTPTAGVNGLNITLKNITAFKDDNPAQTGEGVIEIAAGVGADPIIIAEQIIPLGYDHTIRHIDSGKTSDAREFCYFRNAVQRFCLQAGKVLMEGLPTSDPGVPGQIWNSAGDLKVSQ